MGEQAITMICSRIALCIFALAGSMASPIKSDRLSLEVKTTDLADGWSLGPRSPEKLPIKLMFGLRQTNLDQLEQSLLAVSDPQSPEYGRHLSNDQVHELIAPTSSSINAVRDWLSSHGIVPQVITPNSDWLTATMSIGSAEKLLEAEYYQISHSETNTTSHRTLQYSVPSHVAAVLDLVAPTL